MSPDISMDVIEDKALSGIAVRETKGARTRRKIMAEARAMIDEMSIEAISQEAIARRIGITQSALRHHFPTKEALFDAIFEEAFAGFYTAAEDVLERTLGDARQRLLKLCTLHFDYVASESDRVTIGSFAHHLYNRELLGRQGGWYQWMTNQYATLLRAIRPDLDGDTVNARALAILTIGVGAWITVGRSRPEWSFLAGQPPKIAMLAAIESLIDA